MSADGHRDGTIRDRGLPDRNGMGLSRLTTSPTKQAVSTCVWARESVNWRTAGPTHVTSVPGPAVRPILVFCPTRGAAKLTGLGDLTQTHWEGPVCALNSNPTAAPCPEQPQPKSRHPFVMLPNDIAADPRLTPTDLRMLAALLYFARQDGSCYPSDFSLGERACKHPSTVRRALHRLERLGYIRRSFFPATRANPTGRLIYLDFTSPDWPRPSPAPAQPQATQAPPAHRCAGPAPDISTSRAAPRAPLLGRGEHSCSGPPRTGARRRR